MQALAMDQTETLNRLQMLAQSDRLPARDAARCAHLADTLQMPVRVCLLGPASGDLRTMVYAILGSDVAPDGMPLPPAIEMRFGKSVQTQATLEDGTLLTCDGWPDADLLAQAPVFLQLHAPVPALNGMSFLALSLEVNPAMHRPALAWAARRSEIAVWCTPRFSVADARIWANAPERLTHHAYLVETDPSETTPHQAESGSFTGTLHLPIPVDIAPLLNQLTDDIEAARVADIDAAQLLLHRLGHFGQASEYLTIEVTPTPGRSVGQLARLREILSEPTLYLARRARGLAEDLAWVDADTDADWAETAIAHCVETTEGLRERAIGWPDDLPEFASLAAMIDEAADLILLLQMEAGPDQAEDAVGLLHQLRTALDQCRLGHGAAQ